MKVDLLDIMGSDLTVVNAARVSFAAESDEFGSRDKKLIRYLAKHNHWTPFGHVQVQFRVKAPVFVARQLVKHQVGLVWNEVSRRYVSDSPDSWKPDYWRKAAANKKQGSTDEEVPSNSIVSKIYNESVRASIATYDNMIEFGVCPEQARAVLPQAAYTEWYWTGSLYAFSRVCKLRQADDAQAETRYIADQISERCKINFPISWKHLCKSAT